MSDLHQSLYQIQWQTVNELKSLIHSLSENNDNKHIQRIRELENELRKLKKSKRYGLVWEDKPEDIVEKCKNELPILIEDTSKRIAKWWDDLTHILIEWDNYHTLSVLAYTHEKKIDVIYIDPPYNTGNKDFMYNDHFVDKEDTFRHSKWLSFIAKRLELAKWLLKDNGMIYISIDDNEIWALHLLCNEIFWENNFVAKFIWEKIHTIKANARLFSTKQEYVLCYARNIDLLNIKYLERTEKQLWEYKNPDKDPRWVWARWNLLSPKYSEQNDYQIEWPNWKFYKPKQWTSWRYKKERMLELIAEWRVVFEPNSLRQKLFLSERSEWVTPETILFHSEVWHTQMWTEELKKMFNDKIFDYPKPTKLIKWLLERCIFKDAVILDFFAWSGTTWHAVLELNKEDGWKRQFILCTNNENKIAEEVTYPRIRNVINGYADVEGIPANLRYYKTDFIGVDKSIDDLRTRFMGRCTDMLQVRENTFLQFPVSKNGSKGWWDWESEYFRVFQNTEKLLVIMYHPYEIETFKKWFEFLREKEGILQNANVPTHKEIVVYIFSMWWEIFEEELAHLSDRIRIETIPDEVLETYKKIFGF